MPKITSPTTYLYKRNAERTKTAATLQQKERKSKALKQIKSDDELFSRDSEWGLTKTYNDISITVNLDGNRIMYTSGEVITGNISMRLANSTKLKNITFKLVGATSYFYTLNKSAVVQTEVKEFFNHLTCFFKTTKLVGEQFTAGETVYKFAVPLRENLPPSFTGCRGRVFYEFKTSVERLVGDSFAREDELFVVPSIKCYDYRKMKTPLNVSKSITTYKRCCCKKKSIEMSIYSSSSGYKPQEKVELTAIVMNNTDLDVKNIKIQMEQQVTYRRGNDIDYRNSETIVLSEGHTLQKRSKRKFCLSFIIPITAPTVKEDRINISIQYFILATSESEEGTLTVRCELLIAGPQVKEDKASYDKLLTSLPFNEWDNRQVVSVPSGYGNLALLKSVEERKASSHRIVRPPKEMKKKTPDVVKKDTMFKSDKKSFRVLVLEKGESYV